MESRPDTVHWGGSLPSGRAPSPLYRRGYLTSTRSYPMPELEENQFFIKMKKETRKKLHVSEDKREGEEPEDEMVTLLVQNDHLVVVRWGRSWGWKLGCIRRYGYSSTEFYFESGRKSRMGHGMFIFVTDCGERIHSRLTMVKDYCLFDLCCQRGVIPDLLLVNDPPLRAKSLKDKHEREAGQHGQRGQNGKPRRTSTGSLPI